MTSSEGDTDTPQPKIVHKLASTGACGAGGDWSGVFELSDGQVAVVGIDHTDGLKGQLPPDAGCAQDESIVALPAALLIKAVIELID